MRTSRAKHAVDSHVLEICQPQLLKIAVLPKRRYGQQIAPLQQCTHYYRQEFAKLSLYRWD